MSGDPLRQLTRLVEQLRHHPNIEIVKEWGQVNPPADGPGEDADLVWHMKQDMAARAVPGCDLDPALRPLLDRLAVTTEENAGVVWRYQRAGEKRNGGEFCWVSPEPPKDALAWWDYLPTELRELHARLCVLEYHPWTGDGVSVRMELCPGADSAPLWLEHRGRLLPMTIGIGEYFERTIETRGAFGWQVLFCDWAEAPDLEFLELAVDRSQIEDLQQLFPDVDYQPYMRQYEQMRSWMD